jgi:hypothetical protein
MVRFAFSNGGRLKEAHDGTWWVMHTSNDSILAYCSTKEEAEETRKYLGNREKSDDAVAFHSQVKDHKSMTAPYSRTKPRSLHDGVRYGIRLENRTLGSVYGTCFSQALVALMNAAHTFVEATDDRGIQTLIEAARDFTEAKP